MQFHLVYQNEKWFCQPMQKIDTLNYSDGRAPSRHLDSSHKSTSSLFIFENIVCVDTIKRTLEELRFIALHIL